MHMGVDNHTRDANDGFDETHSTPASTAQINKNDYPAAVRMQDN